MIHRFTREARFFEITEEFARPKSVKIPKGLSSISATECATCHQEIAEEWKTSIHAKAWTEPYFQVDFKYDGSQQICKNCHTPLENQQESLVMGFRDRAKYDPILAPNPNFDPELQNEGVTCAACHVDEDGVIVGPFDLKTDAHPTRQDSRFTDGGGVCAKCHMVKGNSWDMFLKLPPCGNFAEIEETTKKANCIKCHMPYVKRPIATGSAPRIGKRHLWRGGHDQDTVKKALKVELTEKDVKGAKRTFEISLTNIGAHHRVPTGTPDRHLEVSFRLFSAEGALIKKKIHILQRTILWRPFVVDLWDSRIKFYETKSYEFSFAVDSTPAPAKLEAEVKYGLLREERRRKIGYQNKEPITYSLFKKDISLQPRQ